LPDRVRISWISLLGRAVTLGFVAMMFVPVLLGGLVLALGYLGGGCGAGDSGGCWMSAGVIGISSTLPAFIIASLWSVFRDLRSSRG
jgi:hypothetical protein